jgi:hypothetical protein
MGAKIEISDWRLEVSDWRLEIGGSDWGLVKLFLGRDTKKIKAPVHSLLGGFQPKPYHNL